MNKEQILANYIHHEEEDYAVVYAAINANSSIFTRSSRHLIEPFELFRQAVESYYEVVLRWFCQDHGLSPVNGEAFHLHLHVIDPLSGKLNPLEDKTFTAAFITNQSRQILIAVNENLPARDLLEQLYSDYPQLIR